MNCRNCVHYKYDNTTGLGDCLEGHEELDPDTCPDFYDKQTAKDDAKLQFAPEGKD